MKKAKQILTFALALLLAFAHAVPAQAANGPNDELGYIYIYSPDHDTEVYLINNFTSSPVGTITGATYDKGTNTLSLNNFNQPTLCITTNTMGDDFKINLTGDNHIQYLGIWGDFHGGSCEFTGTGKLYVNENKNVETAIMIEPEGTKAVFKAGGSTAVYAYAPSGGYPLYVNGIDNKNCIVGNGTPAVTVENDYYFETIPVITQLSSSEKTYDVYTKEGDNGKYVVETTVSSSSAYTVYQCVSDGSSNILCFYKSNRGEFNAAEERLTKTSETVSAKKSESYNTTETLWKDAQGNSFIFDWEWDLETRSAYYKKCSVSEYVKAKDGSGNERQWYLAKETDDKTKYTDNNTAPEQAGYTRSKKMMDNFYIVYISGQSFSLKGTADHTHTYAAAWSSDTNSHWKECTAKDGAKKDTASHTFKEVIDKVATTSAEGSKHEECTVCGYKKASASIPKLASSVKDTSSNATVKVTNAGKVVNGKVTGAEVTYTKPATSKATVTVPDSVTINGVKYAVTSVEKGAFKNDTELTQVTIGNNVKTIGADAFSGCKNLTTVKMGKNVKTICNNAFANDTKLSTVMIGADVTTVGNKAFYKCTSLKSVTIPAKVTKLGSNAFSGCTKLTSATIGKGVKTVSANAFSGCKNLKTVTFKGTKAPSIGKDALKGIKKNAAIKVPKKQYNDYKKKLTEKTGYKKTMKIKKA